MFQVFLEGRGPLQLDPYFSKPREELNKLAWEVSCMPDTLIDHTKGAGYLAKALSYWQSCKWNLQNAVRSAKTDDTILETVFSFFPDHLMIVINAADISLNSKFKKINISIENNGFTLITDQFEYYKNTSKGKIAAGRRKITRNYKILMPYDWSKMEGALSDDGMICLKVPLSQNPQMCPV